MGGRKVSRGERLHGRYARVYARMWMDRGFRALTGLQPSGQALWLYLLTTPHRCAIPGVIVASERQMADELGWSAEAFRQAFREVLGEGGRKPLAEHDPDARLTVLVHALRYDPPASPNVVRHWASLAPDIPESDLLPKHLERLRKQMEEEGLGPAFLTTFDEAFRPFLASVAASAAEAFRQGLPQSLPLPFPASFTSSSNGAAPPPAPPPPAAPRSSTAGGGGAALALPAEAPAVRAWSSLRATALAEGLPWPETAPEAFPAWWAAEGEAAGLERLQAALQAFVVDVRRGLFDRVTQPRHASWAVFARRSIYEARLPRVRPALSLVEAPPACGSCGATERLAVSGGGLLSRFGPEQSPRCWDCYEAASGARSGEVAHG